MLKEIQSGSDHYFIDSLGRYQGEYKSFHSNGRLGAHLFFVDDKLHGESKIWYDNGSLSDHRYYVNGVVVHIFLKNPLTDIEKMLLVLKYGAPLLPKEFDNQQ